ncbi:MAG: MFS transporter [Woeseiaceae bacterium]|nr:MFS transporter [Woeseiaceae bacterium]
MNDTQPALALENVFGIKKEEFTAVAWSFIYFFCVLSSYYMLRSVRETMAAAVGAVNIPWLFSGTFVAMLLVAPVFGWIASRYPRRRFLPWVYYFFAFNILLFWLGFSSAIEQSGDFVWLGVAFFIWLSVFNLFVVSVFWSFMADIYTKSQSRRVFGIISAGGSAGALLGPLATSELVVLIGFQNLLPISAAILLFGVVCITQLRRWVEAEHVDDIETTAASDKPLGGSLWAGATALYKTRFLLVICGTSIIASLLGTALYMFMIDLVGEAFSNPDERTQVFARIDAATNFLALFMQMIVVKQSVSRLGVGLTLAIMPFISIIGFALLAFNPAFVVIAILQVVRRSVGFGLSKPTNDMLYSVVPPEQKYKSKNFIDTAIYRGGDLIGTWTIRLLLPLGIPVISLVLLPFAAIWVGLAIWLGREYRRRDSALSEAPGSDRTLTDRPVVKEKTNG